MDLIEDCIAEAELERIGELSPEELEAEMRAKGYDPSRAREIARRALEQANAPKKQSS
jgi:hypothetical protein